MNVIYMHTHDCGRYLSPYGYAVPTPNVMEFARSATLFRQAYCAGPTCSPSRAALLTGMSPHECGMQGLAHRGWQLNDYSKHMANVLKSAGFHTALCGIQHVAPDAQMIGYDEIIGNHKVDMADAETAMSSTTGDTPTRPASTSRRVRNRLHLSFGMFAATHGRMKRPGISTPRLPGATPRPCMPAPPCGRDMAELPCHTSARSRTNAMARLLAAIDEAGIRDETMVTMHLTQANPPSIDPFPHMKCNLYDAGCARALMIRLPKGASAESRPTRARSRFRTLDIFPTRVRRGGHPKGPTGWREHSLLPLMHRGRSADGVRDEVFLEVTYHDGLRAYARRAHRPVQAHPSSFDPYIPQRHRARQHRRRFFQDVPSGSGLWGAVNPREALYDLWLDPAERENLAGTRGNAAV
jgi:arylsulfatase A-like enzyme